MTDPSALNQQFGIDSKVRFEPGNGGLTRAVIQTDLVDGEIYLHGAHVTRFAPKGQKDILWMSGQSMFQANKPIRGGVPICFPWFGNKAGDPSAPGHGFARLMDWTVESVKSNADGAISITLKLESSEATRAHWQADFVARFTATFGKSLHMAFAVTNRGSAPVSYQEALHSYFTIGDIKQISIEGLANTTYIDKMNNAARTPQGSEPIRFSAETDRVYLATQATCIVNDPVLNRRITVEKSGSNTTVVWNPWNVKAKAMADFGDEEWPGMVCVETCNVADHAVTLAPGATHTITATIR